MVESEHGHVVKEIVWEDSLSASIIIGEGKVHRMDVSDLVVIQGMQQFMMFPVVLVAVSCIFWFRNQQPATMLRPVPYPLNCMESWLEQWDVPLRVR